MKDPGTILRIKMSKKRFISESILVTAYQKFKQPIFTNSYITEVSNNILVFLKVTRGTQISAIDY